MSVQEVYMLYCDECGAIMDYEGFKNGILLEDKGEDNFRGTQVGIGVYRCLSCDNVYLIPAGEEPVIDWFSPPS